MPTGQTVTVTTLMADRFVVAPLVNLSVSSSLIQGFSGTAPKAVGSYGYAVLDEGIKAKVNIRDDFDTGEGSRTSQETAARDQGARGHRHLLRGPPAHAGDAAGRRRDGHRHEADRDRG